MKFKQAPSAFVYNGAHVNVNFTTPMNLCDRQRISDWNNSKGCECYGMAPNSSGLAIQHAITVNVDGETFKMDEFSSKKFSSLYFNDDIPGSVRLFHL